MSITPFNYITAVKPTFDNPGPPKPTQSAQTPTPLETIKEDKFEKGLKGAEKIKATALDDAAARALKGQAAHASPIATVDKQGQQEGAYVQRGGIVDTAA